MPEYQILTAESPKALCTIAGALEVLREQAGFRTDDVAQLRVGPFPGPFPGIWLVSLVYQPSDETIFGVSVPSATGCTCIPEGASTKENFEISRLDGASVDDDAKVALADGIKLRAVKVEPAHLPRQPSQLDWKIIRAVIAINNAEARCAWRFSDHVPVEFRKTVLPDALPDEIRAKVPNPPFIDCSTLVGLDERPLKVIASLIREKDSTLAGISDQKISDTLDAFGVRSVRRRRRVQVNSDWMVTESKPRPKLCGSDAPVRTGASMTKIARTKLVRADGGLIIPNRSQPK